MTTYRDLGTTTDMHTCEECGREDLRKAVRIVPTDVDGNPDGEVFHVGTDCAARMLGYTAGRMRGAVKAAETRREIDLDRARELWRRWSPVLDMPSRTERATYWVRLHPEHRDHHENLNAWRARKAAENATDEIRTRSELHRFPLPARLAA